jgi:hypothetical protein
MGDRVGLGCIAVQLGSLAARQGQYETALRHYVAGLKELYERGCGLAAIGWLAELATVLVAAGQGRAGLRLAAASAALNAAYDIKLIPVVQEERDHAVTHARTELDEREAAAIWAEGQALTLEQAIALAMDESPPS